MTTEQDAFTEINAELMLLRLLVASLIATHPNKAAVAAAFQRELAGLQATVPPGTDAEFVVELRARALVYLSILAEN